MSNRHNPVLYMAETDIEKLRLAPKEVFYIISVLGGFFLQYYTLKMEIRETMLSMTMDKKVSEMRFSQLEASVFDLKAHSENCDNRITALEAILPQQPTYVRRK